jgi:hypothetical protein
MKNRTKISLLLALTLTASMSVSANTKISESMFSKKIIHNLVQQSIDSSLDGLLDELKILDAPITPVMPISPIISKTESAIEIINMNPDKKDGKEKIDQTS